jgi:hypothetical protein
VLKGRSSSPRGENRDMKYKRRFKDEYVVIFDNDKFRSGEKLYLINGMTGVDVDNNVIQLRDDLYIAELPLSRPLSFIKMMTMWDELSKDLLRIVKKKNLIKRERV